MATEPTRVETAFTILALLLVSSCAVPLQAQLLCTGDCSGDEEVVIGELVTAVNVALGAAEPARCVAADADADGNVAVNELIGAVGHALGGCPSVEEIDFGEVLRTPDEAFAALPGYDFEPRYLQVGGIRIHYVDEGPAAAPPVLLLHGTPSWSYLWREVIPPLAAAGFRVIAPDLVGFGRSDKPASRQAHTYKRQADWMLALIEALDLRGITLVCHDWGGLIGLRLAAEHGERFDRIVATNTALPTGDETPSAALLGFIAFVRSAPVLPIGSLIDAGAAAALPAEVIAAYDAPFPSEELKAGPRALPDIIPVTPDNPATERNRRARASLRAWQKPFLTAFSDGDPFTAGWEAVFQAEVPGAAGRVHPTVRGAGHFLQEDAAGELAGIVVELAR